MLASPGRSIDPDTRASLEARFGRDFSGVRVHTDSAAAASADALDAVAYTVGTDVVFSQGAYRPGSEAGRRLLAHELTHVAQGGGTRVRPDADLRLGGPGEVSERQADAVAHGAGAGTAANSDAGSARDTATGTATAPIEGTVAKGTAATAGRGGATPNTAATTAATAAGPAVIRRQHRAPGPVSIRSPVAEEAVTQVSDTIGAVSGRALLPAEVELASGVFGRGLDLSRVRLIPTKVLEYRTVGNNVRVPEHFTIDEPYMAQTLIHELTHVWQYQHGGTDYLSHSLQTQAAAGLRGNRDYAYDYELGPRSSFFEYTPEQQASIVENYFSMLRDRTTISGPQGQMRDYFSNHQGPDGFRLRQGPGARSSEITRELPLHERVIAQMRAALPQREVDLRLHRASEVMGAPGPDFLRDPQRDVTPVKPLLELRF
ncbi:DUF4157 domain-containing protein [Catenulispora yoronensis]